MNITKVNITNYKCFKGTFSLNFTKGMNIIVGNNGTGKSTIIEAIHLALTGLLNGKYLRNEINQYLFNSEIVKEYLDSLTSDNKKELPEICIEIFFDECGDFLGNGNSEHRDTSGIQFKICFDESYKGEYQELIKTAGKLQSLPIEYYKIQLQNFGRTPITTRIIPIRSFLIDVSISKTKNGSDIYVSRIIQNNLTDKNKVELSQAYRQMVEDFSTSDAVTKINELLSEDYEKKISINADLPNQNTWETALMTSVDNIPFSQIGQGAQSIIKTKLALEKNQTEKSKLILIEEPENHLSHTYLNGLISKIAQHSEEQMILTTHSSFVANKLGLENLILLSQEHKTTRLSRLDAKTFNFFKKIPGYPTLRLILSKKTVLVEGDSDELIFQKAYMKKNNNRLPIMDEIDVISVVGLSFKRYLDISVLLAQPTCVITDNDHDYDKNIKQKYLDYEEYDFIKIFADNRDKLNTLEPQFYDANRSNIDLLKKIIKTNKSTETDIIKYMETNKTTWALNVFESSENLEFPSYIMKAVDWCKNGK